MAAISWQEMFKPDKSIWEIIIRGSIVYLALFFMLRFLTKREAGTLGITDLLVLVLLADASQNAMSGQYNSISDGIILVATIVSWSTVLNILAYKNLRLRKIIKPPKRLLIKDGRFVRRNMQKEFITEEELMGEVRAQGIKSAKQVQEAYMESDGVISVIKKGGGINRHKTKSKTF